MGEAARRRQQLAALIDAITSALGQPRELSAREAAALLAEQRYLVLVADNEMSSRVFNILAHTCGADLGFICLRPNYDPDQPRPSLRLYEPRAGRHYPPVILGFLPDTLEHRAILEATVDIVATHAGEAPGGPPVGTHPSRAQSCSSTRAW
jgi:hypothetical protein